MSKFEEKAHLAAAIAQVLAMYEAMCQRGCGNEATAPHTCPFASEIQDDETLCNCCPDCAHECAMDI